MTNLLCSIVKNLNKYAAKNPPRSAPETYINKFSATIDIPLIKAKIFAPKDIAGLNSPPEIGLPTKANAKIVNPIANPNIGLFLYLSKKTTLRTTKANIVDKKTSTIKALNKVALTDG